MNNHTTNDDMAQTWQHSGSGDRNVTPEIQPTKMEFWPGAATRQADYEYIYKHIRPMTPHDNPLRWTYANKETAKRVRSNVQTSRIGMPEGLEVRTTVQPCEKHSKDETKQHFMAVRVVYNEAAEIKDQGR